MKNFFIKYKKVLIIVGAVVIVLIGAYFILATRMQPKNELLDALEDNPSGICTVYNSVEYNKSNPMQSTGDSDGNTDNDSSNTKSDISTSDSDDDKPNETDDGQTPPMQGGMTEITDTLDTICADNSVSDEELTQLEELKNSDSIKQMSEMQNNQKTGFFATLKSLFSGNKGGMSGSGRMSGGTPPSGGNSGSRPEGAPTGTPPNR